MGGLETVANNLKGEVSVVWEASKLWLAPSSNVNPKDFAETIESRRNNRSMSDESKPKESSLVRDNDYKLTSSPPSLRFVTPQQPSSLFSQLLFK
jgi:hypothetical protein